MEFLQVFILLVFAILTTSQGRVILAPRQARLTYTQSMPYYFYNNIDGQPGTYSYGYDVADPGTGNSQFRTEDRYANGTVVGSYGYVDAWGRPQRYRYIADERGYRVMNDPPYKPQVVEQRPYVPGLSPGSAPESSITWTRPKKPNKNKNNNIYRPQYNLVGPPSSYVED